MPGSMAMTWVIKEFLLSGRALHAYAMEVKMAKMKTCNQSVTYDRIRLIHLFDHRDKATKAIYFLCIHSLLSQNITCKCQLIKEVPYPK